MLAIIHKFNDEETRDKILKEIGDACRWPWLDLYIKSCHKIEQIEEYCHLHHIPYAKCYTSMCGIAGELTETERGINKLLQEQDVGFVCDSCCDDVPW